jgi:hypothetical protein
MFTDFYSAGNASRNGHGHDGCFATFEDGHRITLVIEAIIESHRSGSWIEVATLDTVRK